MRIVLASHVARSSGAEIVLERLALELDRAHDVHVVVLQDGPVAERLREAGVDVHVVAAVEAVVDARKDAGFRAAGASAIGSVKTASAVRRLLRVLAPDVVHAHSLKSGLMFGSAARSLRIPMVWHVHDRITPDYLGRMSLLVARAGLRVLPDAVAVNSQSASDTFRSRGVRSVVPNPVELLGPPRDPVVARGPVATFGIVGRITPWKGQDVVLRALHRAFPDGPESVVVVGDALFGEDAFGDELRTLVSELGLQSRVRFAGHHEDVAGALRDIDVLVHASRLPEPFGLVVFEALRMGVPVIAADAGGPAEHLRDGEHALLTSPGDVDALAGAMRRMRDDPDLRSALSQAGRAAGDAFRPEHAAGACERLYAEVVRRGSRERVSRPG